MLGDLPIELAAAFKVRFVEFCMCRERQGALFREAAEAGVVLVALRVQRASQQILGVVVRQLIVISEIAVARIEALRLLFLKLSVVGFWQYLSCQLRCADYTPTAAYCWMNSVAFGVMSCILL